jgi:hypothetical protein
MKISLTYIIVAQLLASIGLADTNYYLSQPKSPMSKLEATKAALNSNQAVYRCNEVKLTEKMTFKNVKAPKVNEAE